MTLINQLESLRTA